MYYRLLIAFLAVGFVAAHAVAEEVDPDMAAAQKDLAALQGTWEIVSAQTAGADVTKDLQARSPKITFQKDVWAQDIDGKPLYTAENSHIKLGALRSPKAMDHVVTRTMNGQQAAVAYPGIYELDGDNLKLCWDVGLKQRPTKFASETGGESFYVTLKRSKAAQK